MKFIPVLLILCSCAVALPKEKAKKVATFKKSESSLEKSKFVLSRITNTDGEKMLYENNKEGILSFQLVEYCRPEANGKLELIFKVDIKQSKDELAVYYTGEGTRYLGVGHGLIGNPLVVSRMFQTDPDILCDEKEVQAVYSKVTQMIEEELKSRDVAGSR
jgi:hypothetical protein